MIMEEDHLINKAKMSANDSSKAGVSAALNQRERNFSDNLVNLAIPLDTCRPSSNNLAASCCGVSEQARLWTSCSVKVGHSAAPA